MYTYNITQKFVFSLIEIYLKTFLQPVGLNSFFIGCQKESTSAKTKFWQLSFGEWQEIDVANIPWLMLILSILHVVTFLTPSDMVSEER